MGMQQVCDECGVVLDEIDRVQVSSMSMNEGSVRLDLCFTCGDGVRKTPKVKKHIDKQKEKVDKARAGMPAPGTTPANSGAANN